MNDQILSHDVKKILEQSRDSLGLLTFFAVSGNTEAEGNAKFHQQVQCDSSQLLNRPLYRNDFSVCFW